MLNTSRNASRIPSKIKEKNQDEDLEVDSIIEKTKKFINLRSDDTPTLDIHLMIVLDESNLIIDEPPLTPQDFVSSITKLGESNLKVKSIIDITQYFENNKISIDTLEEKRRSKEHSIKDFVICDINKKTEYLLKMITKIDQKDERIREVLKNRYNYIVMFNKLNIIIVNKLRTLDDLDKVLNKYFEDYHQEGILEIDEIITVIEDYCEHTSIGFIDATEFITRGDNLDKIMGNKDQIALVKYSEQNSEIFFFTAGKLDEGAPENLIGTLLVFNGPHRSIIVPEHSKHDILSLVAHIIEMGRINYSKKHNLMRRKNQLLNDKIKNKLPKRGFVNNLTK